MSGKGLDLSATSQGRVIVTTVLVTLGCIALAFAVDSMNFAKLTAEEWPRHILVNICVPIGVALPTMYFLMSKLRELAIAHRRLQIIASTDSLTAVLNRGAFTLLVDAYLTEARAQDEETRGALLVVDADNFKTINDSYGHDHGDEALQIIARAITAVLRSADIVGRIGGEEFGVFLPGSNPSQAAAVAERIRASVNVAEFCPRDGERQELSVSVGGAIFERRVAFTELFRLADRLLYDAKEKGRNRVSLASVRSYATAA